MDVELAQRVRLGEELLARGEYAEGFELYESWRGLFPDKWNALPIPRWTGQDIAGKRFLIVGEQGFGDQIMYARFAKLLQAKGAEVAWLCDPALERLFTRCLGVPAVSPASGVDLDDVSFYCPSSGLPNLFFPGLREPPPAPYFRPPLASVVPGLRVGVNPTGNLNHGNPGRSLPEDLARELLTLPGAVDLRPEATGARDFYDTASIIAGLDLVVSVDTAAAHLAGAMGKPTWVLLQHDADWRWLRDRADSPWYPSARLFRQPSQGDWRTVVSMVEAAI